MTTETTPVEEVVFDEPEPGIYEGTFVACEPFSYEDANTGTKEDRWRWVFSISDTQQLDTLTSRTFRPGTSALKLFTGILGRAPIKGDKPADYYGKMVNVVYGANRAGRLTVTDVHPLRSKS